MIENPPRKQLSEYLPRYFLVILLGFSIAFPIVGKTAWRSGIDRLRRAGNIAHPDRTGSADIDDDLWNKADVRTLLENGNFINPGGNIDNPGGSLNNLEKRSFDISADGGSLRIDTNLDISLQKHLLKTVASCASRPRATPRYVAIVIMDPRTGKIHSMVSFDEEDPLHNSCLDSGFPAASIFKIITAGAAVEECDLVTDSSLAYSGGRYTLYRNQLRDRTNRWTNWTTFRQSFALSINPVFGKIGMHRLGKETLAEYALAFGFNRRIDFELPVSCSTISLTDEPYQWAEIACGFNRETRISPLHGAIIASAVLNGGEVLEPTIIDRIADGEGRTLYRGRSTSFNQALTTEACDVVKDLMKATIRYGTCKKAFRGSSRDDILSRLEIGGKSGSISNVTRDYRYDWFVGFAEGRDCPEKIAVSVVVAHQEYIGVKAADYARIAIRKYFQDFFSRIETAIDVSSMVI